MQDQSLPIVEYHHPATFAGRGVALPFTTPALAGARVRDTGLSAVELVVPNPSGGRGFYIVEWDGTRSLCTPTVHDTLLFQQVSRLPRIDPASIRSAALDVARQGYAGRAAAAAAVTALRQDHGQRQLAQFRLLVGLVDQVQPDGPSSAALSGRTEAFDRRASEAFMRIAPEIGRPPVELANGLAALGERFAATGVGMQDGIALIPRLLDRMDRTRMLLTRWLNTDPDHDIGAIGQMLSESLQARHRIGQDLLASTRALVADPMALLRRWVARPDETLRLGSRCEWLLDGWDRICRIWQAAEAAESRRGALLEMVQLLPVMPREASEWVADADQSEAMEDHCRIFSQNDSWRRGSAGLKMTRRNEALWAQDP